MAARVVTSKVVSSRSPHSSPYLHTPLTPLPSPHPLLPPLTYREGVVATVVVRADAVARADIKLNSEGQSLSQFTHNHIYYIYPPCHSHMYANSMRSVM